MRLNACVLVALFCFTMSDTEETSEVTAGAARTEGDADTDTAGMEGAAGGAGAEGTAAMNTAGTENVSKMTQLVLGLSVLEKQELLDLLQGGAKPKTSKNVLPPVKDEKPSVQQLSSGSLSVPVNPADRSVAPDNRIDQTKIPKLPKFSGVTSKNEPSYRVWKFSVENLRTLVSEREVIRAIHNSVSGSPAETLMRLGHRASLTAILTKFDNIYGKVISSEKLLEGFYTAEQTSTESVADWSCRLEDILSHPQLQDMSQRDDMLKSRFFHGLSNDSVQNAIRHRFKDGNYEELLVLAREAESECKVKAKAKPVSKPQVVDGMQKQMDELKKLVTDLNTKVDNFTKGKLPNEKQVSQVKDKVKPSNEKTTQSSSNKVTCNYCKQIGHYKSECQKLKALNAKRDSAGSSQ